MLDVPRLVDEPLLLHGDCLDHLATLPAASVDVVITDPPAGIAMMHSTEKGRVWDDFRKYEPRTRAGRNAQRMLSSAMDSAAALRSLAAAVKQARADAKTASGADKRTTDAVAKALARALADARAAHRIEVGDLADFAGLPRWASGFVAFLVDVWTEVDRVLKPGGIVCAWALPKTADLAGLAMRLAGWEVADSLLHLFASAMAKSGDVGKKIDALHGAEREVIGKHPNPNGQSGGTTMGDGWSEDVMLTAPATEDAKRWTDWSSQLAPGHEQWIIAIKPTPLTDAAQVLAHGTGLFNIGRCRVPRGEADRERSNAAVTQGSGLARGYVYGEASETPAYAMSTGGSWPKNVVISEGGQDCPVTELDQQSGVQRDGTATKRPGCNPFSSGDKSGETVDSPSYNGSGGASRFFTKFKYTGKNRNRRAGLRSDMINDHVSPKSDALMRWLVGLLAAKAEHTGGLPAIVLDPMMGSGSTGVACVAERVRFIGIERDPVPDAPAGAVQSFHIARARILAAIGSIEAAAEANAAAPVSSQLVLL